MKLSKDSIGDFVETISIKCGDAKCGTVMGINIDKQFIASRNIGEDTSKYLLVPPNCFAFNLMHVGRDEKIPVAFNSTLENLVVSPAYFVFKVTDEKIILREYLYILMSSPEFDRYSWFCTDSSIRGNLDWGRFCDIEIDLPPSDIQQKYVNVYNSMKKNQAAYERGLDDLKLTCDAYVENLIKTLPHKMIGEYIELSEERNSLSGFGAEFVRGISTGKEFILTKADLGGVGLSAYKVVRNGSFVYAPDTSRRGDKISLAFNATDETCLVSSIYVVFRVKQAEKLLPEYMLLYFSRSEFDRYTRFHSWGSAREAFSWDDMREVKIPIPDIKIQEAIVNIYKTYTTRRSINEKLKAQMKDICPILIKGAVEEAKNPHAE